MPDNANPTHSTSSEVQPVQSSSERFSNQVRFPRFDAEHIEQWFWQLEATMEISNLTNDRKRFMTVVSLVEPRILTHLGSLINNPPADGTAFAQIKKLIIDRYVSTAADRIRKLLSELTLGDKRPLHLVEEMKSLSDGKIDETVLIQL